MHVDDVILAAMVLRRTGEARFRAEPSIIHAVFRDLAQRYPDLLTLRFSPDTAYPYSQDLADSLGHLLRSGLIAMTGPQFREYVVEETAHEVFRRVARRERVASSTRTRLLRLSEDFWALLGSR